MSSATTSSWQRAGPIVTLLLLSPVIAEVLPGTTRITTFFVLIPQIGVWGCAALIIRELVRRRRGAWHAVLLLGLALAVAEECVIQQTSLAPLIGIDPNRVYGRALGVNWVYFLWALGFESIWAVVLPIQLTELIFPARRDEPWMGRRGIIVSAIVAVLASLAAWYSWTQVFVPKFFPASVYRVPFSAIGIALVAIAALVVAALMAKPSSRAARGATRPSPSPWLVGLAAFGIGLPWFLMVLLAFSALPRLPAVVPILVGLALAGLAYFLIAYWSSSAGWEDAHRLALVVGIVIATAVGGFAVLAASNALLIDRIGQLAFNAVAILLLVRLARTLSRSKGECPDRPV